MTEYTQEEAVFRMNRNWGKSGTDLFFLSLIINESGIYVE